MPVCTKCGAIIHPDDVDKHTHNPATLMTKGKERYPSGVSERSV